MRHDRSVIFRVGTIDKFLGTARDVAVHVVLPGDWPFPANYSVDTFSCPTRLVLRDDSAWPATGFRPFAAGLIEFSTGYGTAAKDVPAALATLVAHWYLNREAAQSVPHFASVPLRFADLLAPYRLWL